jgi:hypothetical protein
VNVGKERRGFKKLCSFSRSFTWLGVQFDVFLSMGATNLCTPQ